MHSKLKSSNFVIINPPNSIQCCPAKSLYSITVQIECKNINNTPDSKVHGANMGPIWGQQEPGGPHVGPMNFAIWDSWLAIGCLLRLLIMSTVECRYNMIQLYDIILHKWFQFPRHNINHSMNLQKTPHTSPSRASYVVSFVRIFKKIDHVITTLYLGWNQSHYNRTTLYTLKQTLDKAREWNVWLLSIVMILEYWYTHRDFIMTEMWHISE